MWCFLSFQSKRIFVKSMSLGADILKLVLQLQKNKGIDVEMKIIEKSIVRYSNRISMSNTKEIRIIENLDIWSGWWGDMTWQKKTRTPGSWPRPDMAQWWYFLLKRTHNRMFNDMMGTIILSEPACLKYSDADLHLSHLSS